VLDAGSGIVGLGETLDARGGPIPILLTHYHWDHIQGLPFFTPFYRRGWQPTIFAPIIGSADRAFVETIFQTPFFPVPFDSLESRPDVVLIPPRAFEIGEFQIRVQPLTHPGGAFAYRIKGDQGDLVYATDHEFVGFAKANRIGQLWLFHHKPGRTDEEMAEIATHAQAVFPSTSAASEGAAFDL
jgi:phosphoribosyl 1,2-cyclic phosphodiesterase